MDKEKSLSEWTYPFSCETYLFVGKKPAAVMFGKERVDVKSWRGVYAAILKRCNDDPKCHEMLMYLRNKTAGKVRLFLSDKPDGMSQAYMIDTDLYGEIHFGTESLMHVLCKRILDYTGFDYRSIKIVLK